MLIKDILLQMLLFHAYDKLLDRAVSSTRLLKLHAARLLLLIVYRLQSTPPHQWTPREFVLDGGLQRLQPAVRPPVVRLLGRQSPLGTGRHLQPRSVFFVM